MGGLSSPAFSAPKLTPPMLCASKGFGNEEPGGSELLLDTYPNAAVAYSLRKLRSDYTGAAIRVRESGGDTEADIGYDANGNLDETALLNHTGSNDGFVTTWHDQQGSNNITQATSSVQPRVVSAGTIEKSGAFPGLRVYGNSIGMKVPNIHDGKDHSWVSLVIEPKEVGSAKHITSGPWDSEWSWSELTSSWDGSKPTFQMQNGVDTGVEVVANQMFLIQHGCERTAPTTDIWIDGLLVVDGDTSLNSTLAFDNNGSIGYDAARGKSALGNMFFELIVYDTDGSGDRSGVEGNINDYYSIF